MKNKLKILFCVTTLALSLMGCRPTSSTTPRESNYSLIEAKKTSCPKGTYPDYIPWGEAGMELRCLVNNGPVVIAENGHVAVTGQYLNGKKRENGVGTTKEVMLQKLSNMIDTYALVTNKQRTALFYVVVLGLY